jgi:aminoacrylate hydrolase
MPTIRSTAADIHYEVLGQGSPVLLIAGLGGVGAAWGPQMDLFAERHTVIVPDHRGTGKSTHTEAGLTIAQHAADFAAIVEHLGVGPVHCIGLSTGGAVTQALALEHSRLVRTATIASSWARGDPFFLRQFEVRKQMLAAAGVRAANELAALFVFDPRFQATDPAVVQAWVDAATAGAGAPEISMARIDMIMAHDLLDRLSGMRCPTLVIVGESDFCMPPHLSEQMAERIPGAELVKLPGGHFSYLEHPAAFHDRVEAFIARHGG